MKEVYGIDDKEVYFFTGKQIFQEIKNHKIRNYFWEYNSVDGFIFCNKNGSVCKKPNKALIEHAEKCKAIMLSTVSKDLL